MLPGSTDARTWVLPPGPAVPAARGRRGHGKSDARGTRPAPGPPWAQPARRPAVRRQQVQPPCGGRAGSARRPVPGPRARGRRRRAGLRRPAGRGHRAGHGALGRRDHRAASPSRVAGPPRARGGERVLQALALAEDRVLSPMETWLRLVWVLDAGLPRPRCNWPVADLTGRRLGRPDLLCEELGVVVEYDGAEHRSRARHGLDVRREADFRDAGLEVVTVVATDVPHPDRVVARMQAAVDRSRAADRPGGGWWPRDPVGSEASGHTSVVVGAVGRLWCDRTRRAIAGAARPTPGRRSGRGGGRRGWRGPGWPAR